MCLRVFFSVRQEEGRVGELDGDGEGPGYSRALPISLCVLCQVIEIAQHIVPFCRIRCIYNTSKYMLWGTIMFSSSCIKQRAGGRWFSLESWPWHVKDRLCSPWSPRTERALNTCKENGASLAA